MATARKSVAKQTFVAILEGGYRVVQAGEELEATDPVVKANAGLFEPKKT